MKRNVGATVIPDLFGADGPTHAKPALKGVAPALARVLAGEAECPKVLKNRIRALKRAKNPVQCLKPKTGAVRGHQYTIQQTAPSYVKQPAKQIDPEDTPGNTIRFTDVQVQKLRDRLLRDFFAEYAIPFSNGCDIDPWLAWDYASWMLEPPGGAFGFHECLRWSSLDLPESFGEDLLHRKDAAWALVPDWLHPILRLPRNEQGLAVSRYVRGLEANHTHPTSTRPSMAEVA